MTREKFENIVIIAIIIICAVVMGVEAYSEGEMQEEAQSASATVEPTVYDRPKTYPVYVNYASQVGSRRINDDNTSTYNETVVTMTNLLDCVMEDVQEQSIIDAFSTNDPDDVYQMKEVSNALGVVMAGNKVLNSATMFLENGTGTSLDELMTYVNDSHLPAIIWVTSDYKAPSAPTKDRYGVTNYSNPHLAILLWRTEDAVTLEDCYDGRVTMPIAQLEPVYDTCGRQCVEIMEN